MGDQGYSSSIASMEKADILLKADDSLPQQDVDSANYRRLIQTADSTLLNILAKALREQDNIDAERGLVAILEWQDGKHLSTKLVENSAVLRQELDQTPIDAESLQRLVILQDLPRNHLEVIGSRLKVHPTVFARHWGDTGFLETPNDRLSQGEPCTTVTIPYPDFIQAVQFLELPLRDREEIFRADFLSRRIMAIPKPFGDWDLRGTIAEFEGLMSFWTGNHTERGGWDALIIVDPPIGQNVVSVEHVAASHVTGVIEPRRDASINQHRVLDSTFPNHRHLPADSNTWWNLEKAGPARSNFHQLIKLFEADTFRPDSDPLRSFGHHIREVAIEKWVVFLNHAMHCLVLTRGEPYYNNGHFNSAISSLWASSWEEWLLARLVKWSRRLAMERTTINSILYSFGHSLGATGSHFDSPQPSRSSEDAPAFSTMTVDETRRWCWIYDKLGEYKDLYDNTTESYIQVLQLRESQIANKQARSVGNITVLGALFVPISIVSSIMSMGGAYIPGGERFWTFWAVTVPILFVIFFCLFTNILDWSADRVLMTWRRFRRRLLTNQDGVGAQEAPMTKKLSFTKRIP